MWANLLSLPATKLRWLDLPNRGQPLKEKTFLVAGKRLQCIFYQGSCFYLQRAVYILDTGALSDHFSLFS